MANSTLADKATGVIPTDPEIEKAQLGYDELLQSFQSIQLATASSGGQPEVSYSPATMDQHKNFYVHVSELSAHTANLQTTGKASVLVIEDESNAQNIFARRRVSYNCEVKLVERHSDAWEAAMAQFEDKFGKMVSFLKTMEDFHLFRLKPTKGRLVLGFGKAYDVTGESLSDLKHIGGGGKGHRVEKDTKHEPLDKDRIAHIIEHMNDDHSDSVLAYAQHFGKRPEADSAELLALNPEEMRIKIHVGGDTSELSVPFEKSLKSGHDAHMTMIKMSKAAKRALEA